MSVILHSDILILLAVDLLLWAWLWLTPPLVLRSPWLPEGILGLALPGLILVRREAYTWTLLRHELTHWRQMRRWSPLGTSLVQAWAYLVRPLGILARYRRWPGLAELYRANPLEREAFAAEGEQDPLPRTWGALPEFRP